MTHRTHFTRRAALSTALGLSAGLTLTPLASRLAPQIALAQEGLAPADTSGTFSAMSWESEEEMQKWLQYLNEYLDDHYAEVKLEPDYGLPWNDYWTKLQTSIAGGAPPTMAWMHDSRAKSFASLDLLEPLDDFIAELAPDGWPDSYFPTQVGAFQYDGKQYAIPYDWAPGGLYINRDLFDQVGSALPDETWTFDQLLEVGLKIKAAGDDPDNTWGFSLPTWSGGLYWIVKCFGGEGFTDDPVTSHWDDPNTIAAFQFLYDAIWTHKVMQSPIAMQQSGLDPEFIFVSGAVGASYGLNDAAVRMNDAIGGAFNWTVAPTPAGPAARAQFVGGSGFAIPKGSNLPEIAYETLRFMATDPSHLDNTAKVGSMFVSRSDYWEATIPSADSGVDPDAYKHSFYDLGKRDGVVPLYHPKYQEWDTSIYTKLTDKLWVGEDSDVAGVLQELQSQTEALLSS